MEWDKSKGKQQGFTVPVKTLLQETGETDFVSKKNFEYAQKKIFFIFFFFIFLLKSAKQKKDITDFLRKHKQKLLNKIDTELNGAPYSIIPVIEYYSSYENKKRARSSDYLASDFETTTTHDKLSTQIQNLSTAQPCVRVSSDVMNIDTIGNWILNYTYRFFTLKSFFF